MMTIDDEYVPVPGQSEQMRRGGRPLLQIEGGERHLSERREAPLLLLCRRKRAQISDLNFDIARRRNMLGFAVAIETQAKRLIRVERFAHRKHELVRVDQAINEYCVRLIEGAASAFAHLRGEPEIALRRRQRKAPDIGRRGDAFANRKNAVRLHLEN